MPGGEATFLGAFKENPGLFVGVIAFGAAGLVSLLVAIFLVMRRSERRVPAFLAAAFGALSIAIGGLSSYYARGAVEQVMQMPGLTESDKAKLRANGAAEAAYPLYLGAGLGLFSIVGGFGCLVLARTRSKGTLA